MFHRPSALVLLIVAGMAFSQAPEPIAVPPRVTDAVGDPLPEGAVARMRQVMTFLMTEHALIAVWSERQQHCVPHADVLPNLRAVDAAAQPTVSDLIWTTGRKGYMVRVVFGWLVGLGALTRIGKRTYGKSSTLRRR